MSDKIITVSSQGIISEFCSNPLFTQDVDSKPVAFKEEKTRHTVKDGRKFFPIFLASFFFRMIGFLAMLVLSILLFIVGSWFTSGQVAANFLKMEDLNTIALISKLAYAAGALSLLISLYLLGTAIQLGNLMFDQRNRSQLKKEKKGPNTTHK